MRDWLFQNHSQKESIWLVIYKKIVPEKYVSVDEVLNQLISFGWIDGIRRKLDNERTMQIIAPRKVEHWSQTCKVRFAKLEQAGLVHQSGFNAVETLKNAGLRDFIDDVDNLIIPDDLANVLNSNEQAAYYFD